MDFNTVRISAQGLWLTRIYPALIDLTIRYNKHQPCPVCGGDTRIRFDDKDGAGTWICNQCGAGDGFALLQKYYGCDAKTAFDKVAGVLGLSAQDVMSPAQIAAAMAKRAEQQKQTDAAKVSALAAAAKKAKYIYNVVAISSLLVADHDYVQRKKISVQTLRAARVKYNTHDGALIIPMYTIDGALVNVQRILPDGTKLFIKNARKKSAFCVIGALQGANTFFVVEGFATGATVWQLLKCAYPVVVCFDAGNIESVCEAIRKKYSSVQWVFAADNDTHLKINTGIEKAAAAAQKFGGVVIAPGLNG